MADEAVGSAFIELRYNLDRLSSDLSTARAKVQADADRLSAAAANGNSSQAAVGQVSQLTTALGDQARAAAEAAAAARKQAAELDVMKAAAERVRVTVDADYRLSQQRAQVSELVSRGLLSEAHAAQFLEQANERVTGARAKEAAAAAASARAAEAIRAAFEPETVLAQRRAQISEAVARGYLSEATAAKALAATEEQFKNGGRAALSFKDSIGQAGFQVQDFFVQVQGGTPILQAATQQGTQVLGAFGPWGAVLGAAGAVAAVVAVSVLGMGDASERAGQAADKQKEQTDDLLKSLAVGGETADKFAASLDSLSSGDRALAAASLAAQVDTITNSLKAAKEEADKAAEAIPNAFRSQAQPVNPSAAGPFVGAFAAATAERQGTNRAGEAEKLLAEFQRTGQGADVLRTRLIDLGQAQGLNATQATALADGLVNTTGKVGALERASAELAARQRLAQGTASDLDRELLDQADTAAKAASALDSYTSVLDRLRRNTTLAQIDDPEQQAVAEAFQSARVEDRPDIGLDELVALDNEARKEARAKKAAEQRKQALQAEEAATKRIAELRSRTNPNDDAALEARVRAQNEGASEGSIRELVRLEKAQRAATQARKDDTKAAREASKGDAFKEDIEAQVAASGRLAAALAQGAVAYDKEKAAIEAEARVRREKKGLSDAEVKGLAAQLTGVKQLADQQARQASVLRTLEDAEARLDRPGGGLDQDGRRIGVADLVGLTPEAIDEVQKRADYVDGILKSLGDQPAEVVADVGARAVADFNNQLAREREKAGAALGAQTDLQVEQEQRLIAVAGQGAAARERVAATIEAEQKVRAALGETTSANAKAQIADLVALKELSDAREQAIQVIEALKSPTEAYAETVERLRQAQAAGGLSAGQFAEAQRRAQEQLSEELAKSDPTSGRQADPYQAARQSLKDYAFEATDIGAQIGDQLAAGFKTAEDAVAQFVKTGKLNIEDLAATIEEDLVKMAIRAFVTGPLANVLGNMMGAPGAGAGAGAGVAAPGPAGPGGLLGHAARGLAFDRGSITPLARGGIFGPKGGIFGGPTLIPLAKGAALAGEAGPEAAVPLIRTSSGSLGVRMEGGRAGGTKVEIHNHSGQPVEQQSRKGPDGEELIEVVIGRVRKEMGRGGFDGVMKGRFGNSPTVNR